MFPRIEGNGKILTLQEQHEKKYNQVAQKIAYIKEPLVITGAVTELVLASSFGYICGAIYNTGFVSQNAVVVGGISALVYARCLQQHYESQSCLDVAMSEINKQKFAKSDVEMIKGVNKALSAYSAASSFSLANMALPS